MSTAKRLSNVGTVDEFITDATVDALNAALTEHRLTPERIIAVHYLEGVYVANGPKARFRVLGRENMPKSVSSLSIPCTFAGSGG